MSKIKNRPRKLPFKVVRLCPECGGGGGLMPVADTANVMRDRKYRVGDTVFAILSKPRNPKFHRLVHAFGEMIKENIKGFEFMDAHQVLKRLQVEGDIGCDEIAVVFPGIGPTTYRIPRSLSFESMDEGEFSTVFKMFCEYVASTYWPGLTDEQVKEMAELIGD